MSLSTDRRRAYTAGALTGAFGALGVVAIRRGRRVAAAVAAGLALVCGAAAVTLEERAQTRDP